MPQWDFLHFLRENGKRFASLKVLMMLIATDLIWSGANVAGVKANTPDGPVDIRADLTIGCDGRHSMVRERADLAVEEIGAPIDVLWFRAASRPMRNESVFARIDTGKMMVTFDRGDYWQLRLCHRQGTIRGGQGGRARRLRDNIVGMAPILKSGMAM